MQSCRIAERMSVHMLMHLPEPEIGEEDVLALIVLIWGGRLVAVILAVFRRRFSALENARLIMFSHGGPRAMLTHSFPLRSSAGWLRAQTERRCCPAASLPKHKLLPGTGLDPNPAAWIRLIREIKAIVVLGYCGAWRAPPRSSPLSQPFW